MLTLITTTELPEKRANYHIIIPLSMTGVLIAMLIACIILLLVLMTKRLHTVTHLLICNASLASVFYCLVQCVNYVFLAVVRSETSDRACRWRGFFGYMSVAAVVYSYLAQAISRYFISILSARYPRTKSFRAHFLLILAQWLVVCLVPLPAVLTEDIYYRPFALCWVPKEYTLHIVYTVVAYYMTPAVLIFAIYMQIYYRVKRRRQSVVSTSGGGRANRELDVLYNIMILFAIYTVGAIPTILFLSTGISVLYDIGLISVSFTVAIEKLTALLLDRDLRGIIALYLRRSWTQIQPAG